MGGSSSTQTADEIENDSKVTGNQNYGLLNFSNESQGLSSDINLLEIVTFAIVGLAFLYFIRILCAKRRKRRLAEMGHHLQNINLHEIPNQPAAPVHVSRVPILSAQPMPAQPPLYPGSQLDCGQLNSAGKYDI